VHDRRAVLGVRVFDDVRPLVEAASTAGIQLGLLTNSSSHYTQQKLEITGLEGVFAVVATRDTLGFGKPDPRAFHHACGLLGTTPNETLYIGDHIEIDAIAANAAGLYAVWLRRDPGDLAGARLAHAHGIPVMPAFASAATPTPAQALKALSDKGIQRPAIASLFVAPGRLPDSVVAAFPDVPVADPLGVSPAFVDLLVAQAMALTAAS